MIWLRTLALYAVVALALFAPALLQGLLLAPDDGFHFYIPAFYGSDRVWDAYLMCGYPSFADPEAMLWYPLRHVPGGLAGWNGIVLSGFVLAGAFFHRWIAHGTKSELAGFAAGFLYAFAGYTMSHLRHVNVLHTVAWFPLVFLALDRLRESPTRREKALLAGAFSMALLAGHPQSFVYLSAAAIAYAAWGAMPSDAGVPRRKFFVAAASAAALGVALAGILVVPMLDLISRSERGIYGATNALEGSVGWAELPRIVLSPLLRGGAQSTEASGVATEAFTGIAGFALAVFAVARGGRRERNLAAIALVAVVLAFGSANWLGRLESKLPVLEGFRVPARHLVITHLVVAALVGVAVARLRRSRAWIAAALVVIEAGTFAFWSEWRFLSVLPSDLERPAFLDPVRDELARTGQRVVPAQGRHAPKESAPPNRSALWGIPTCTGYNPLQTLDVAELLEQNIRAQIPVGHALGPHVGLDLMASRYLTMPESSPEWIELLVLGGRWVRVGAGGETVLLERVDAFPRAWLSRDLLVMERGAILLAVRTGALPGGAPFDPSETALLEEPIEEWRPEVGAGADKSGAEEPDSVAIELDGARVARIRTRSSAPRVLIVSDAWDAGWRVRIDGVPARVLRCNFMFLGIVLSPGEHEVELLYRPRTLVVGAAISGVALLVLAVFALARPKS